MDLSTLQKRQPQAYRAAVQTGIEKERARVQRLQEAQGADPQNPDLKAVVASAIKSGKTVEDVGADIAVAVRDFRPTKAQTGTHSPEVEAILSAIRGTSTEPGKLAKSERARSADVRRVLDSLPAHPGHATTRY